MQNGALVVLLIDQMPAVNWQVVFYQPNAKNIEIDRQPVAPSNKYRIVMWTSSANHYTLYEKQ